MTRWVLVGMLVVQAVMGTLYAVRTPLWQAPDEPAHFNYVRHLVERAEFPVLVVGDYDGAFLEAIRSQKFPPEMSIDGIRYESHQPPLYYLFAAPLYVVAGGASGNAAMALRLLNVALAVGVSFLAFVVLRRVFPGQPLWQLTGVGIIATLPMHLAMGAAVNNDMLAEVLVGAILLVSVLRVQGEMAGRRFIVLGGVLYGLALLTKTTIYSSAVLLILAELGARLAQGGGTVRAGALTARLPAKDLVSPVVRTVAPLFGISLVIAGAWFARNVLVYGVGDPLGWTRHDLVVAGQPTTAAWIAQFGLRNVVVDFFAISFKSFWGQFGWMGVLVDDRLYVFWFLLTAVMSVGALIWVVRLVRGRAEAGDGLPGGEISAVRGWKWAWALLGMLAVLGAAAHVYYNLKYVQPQGRYLFPALIPLAAFWAAGWREVLNPRVAPLLLGLLYVLMVVIDYVALTRFIVPQLGG